MAKKQTTTSLVSGNSHTADVRADGYRGICRYVKSANRGGYTQIAFCSKLVLVKNMRINQQLKYFIQLAFNHDSAKRSKITPFAGLA